MGALRPTREDRPAGGSPAGAEPVSEPADAARRGPLGRTGVSVRHALRTRLRLLFVVPTVALVAVGALQVESAISAMRDAQRGRLMATTAVAASRLVHELERELAEVAALRERGGRSGAALVTAQQVRTDAAVRRYTARASATAAAVPPLRPVLQAADDQLAGLTLAREPSAGPEAAGRGYRTAVEGLITVADALPGQLSAPGLAQRARAVAAITAAEHRAAEQRDLLGAIFTRKALEPGNLVRLSALNAAQIERLEAFQRVADNTARSRYDALVTGPDVEAATRLREQAFAAERDAEKLKVDAGSWYVAQSHTIRRLHLLSLELSDLLSTEAARSEADARQVAWLTGVGLGAVLAGTIAAVLVLTARASRRLLRLRDTALGVAQVELPTAIARLSTSNDPKTVAEARRDAAGQVGGALVEARPDEVGQVARAFSAVYRQALRLGAEQALARLDTRSIFVALARRSQILVQRQLQLIDDFERDEMDPAALERFYRIDHLAARMRRNDENLLVMADSESGRAVTQGALLIDVVRAAAAEIEDYARVEPMRLPDTVVAPVVVGDLVHLLAELLENATVYSPPHARVTVSAVHSLTDVRLYIEDDGIGMEPDALEVANARLAGPAALTGLLAGTMGLLVVSRLAARHQIVVRLYRKVGGGITAVVSLPTELLDTTPVRPVRPVGDRAVAEAAAGPAAPAAPARSPSPARPGAPARHAGPPGLPDGAPQRHGSPRHSADGATPPPGRPVEVGPVAGGRHEPIGVRAEASSPRHQAPVPPNEPVYRWDEYARDEPFPRAGSAWSWADQPSDATTAGLPRRAPGRQLHPGAVATAGPTRVESADPEAVRRRLAGLARGIAAAHQQQPFGSPGPLAEPTYSVLPWEEPT